MKFSPYILLASLISADDVENIKKAEARFRRQTTLETSGEDVKLHSKRVEKK